MSGRLSSVSSPATGIPVLPKVDTIALVSAFRRERKLAHQRGVMAGAVDPDTEGYWDGTIQVVRPSAVSFEDEELDYYGNRFEDGYRYR